MQVYPKHVEPSGIRHLQRLGDKVAQAKQPLGLEVGIRVTHHWSASFGSHATAPDLHGEGFCHNTGKV